MKCPCDDSAPADIMQQGAGVGCSAARAAERVVAQELNPGRDVYDRVLLLCRLTTKLLVEEAGPIVVLIRLDVVTDWTLVDRSDCALRRKSKCTQRATVSACSST